MAREDDARAVVAEVLDGGNGSSDPSIIGDLLVLVERNVEVDSDEHFLSSEISFLEISDASLRHQFG